MPGGRAAKAHARTAGRLMTEPPVTVHADDTIVEAARTMAQHQVERLPVLDEEDRLVGIVTRRDLLQVFLRPDEEIRNEVIDEVLVRALWLPPRSIDVSVVEGVVTLSGHMERKSETEIALSMTRRIDGVVGRGRQAHLPPGRRAPARPTSRRCTASADDWLRKHVEEAYRHDRAPCWSPTERRTDRPRRSPRPSPTSCARTG